MSIRRVVLIVLVAGTLALAIQAPDVATAGSPIGAPFLVGHEEVPTASPAVAYNSIWGEYLVVWQNDRPGFDDIYAQLVSEDGDLVGGRRVITWGTDTERRYPDVAYNPNWNEYLVVWEHHDHATGSFSIRRQTVNCLRRKRDQTPLAEQGAGMGNQFLIVLPLWVHFDELRLTLIHK